ncbi:hypothetical protein FRACYDRAFT_247390 [Fragilariopsis cylindrus CCMP1102]|uniref:Uncharacterized protein n=1 Tax=Fragilariopsis cylindrus CCMP1102 TaxID=635003 RepID=A0A1E7EWX9_9STRA|nr:hypothetical protein FRACYDRAFT_247390 [Fragilariopsis cylindrus CCMP1102]|eukprot:OEU10357.1 hypothetical protein FRACYDRAFT_247390 [Fragilariopsis cylindrus CCMP1102]
MGIVLLGDVRSDRRSSRAAALADDSTVAVAGFVIGVVAGVGVVAVPVPVVAALAPALAPAPALVPAPAGVDPAVIASFAFSFFVYFAFCNCSGQEKKVTTIAPSQESKKMIVDDTTTASIKREDSQDPTVEPIASTTGPLSMNAAAVAAVAFAAVSSLLQTLKNVYKWAATHAHGGDFLKLLRACGGISSVLTFLIKTMYDGNCVGANRMECIKYAALIIGNATYLGENNVNEDIAKKMVTSIMECDGINPLIAASEEYSGGDDIPQLNALDSVWYALRNISCRMDEMKDLIIKDQAIALFDTGINAISHLKSVDYPQASSTVEHIFFTFLNIENRYNMVTVTRADIRDASTATRTVAGIAGVADVAATTVSTAADDDEQTSTAFKLVEVLYSINSDQYSRDEKLRTLKKLRKWACTQDGNFLKLFHAWGGILSVSNFLIKTMNDGNCVGTVRMECIRNAAMIIVNTTDPGENNVNAKKIATSLVEYNGINTMIALQNICNFLDDEITVISNFVVALLSL